MCVLCAAPLLPTHSLAPGLSACVCKVEQEGAFAPVLHAPTPCLRVCAPVRACRSEQKQVLKQERALYTRMIPQLYDVPDAERTEEDRAALRQV